MQTTTATEKQNRELFSQENLHLIYRYVYSYVRNRQEAEDLTSQIFLKAVRSLDLEQSAHSRQAWLFQVARTTIADYWRAHYRRASMHSLEELVEAGWEGPAVEERSTLSSSAEADRVQAILQSLPARYRKVLTYRLLLNLSVRETAVSMGVTEANVKVMQFRALKRAADLDDITNRCLVSKS
jgi:RNA polymerase sigma-70 factor (ECF subfamily)